MTDFENNEYRVYYNTVDIFSGITEKEISLQNGELGVDGVVITAPLEEPYSKCYPLLEHAISHIVFESDVKTAHIFCSRLVDKLLEAGGLPLSSELRLGIDQFLKQFLNLIEDVRVNSLWGRIYRGSAANVREVFRKEYREARNEVERNPHKSIAGVYQSVLSYTATTIVEIPFEMTGRYEWAAKLVDYVLERIPFKSFSATLLLSKWFFNAFFRELLSRTYAAPEGFEEEEVSKPVKFEGLPTTGKQISRAIDELGRLSRRELSSGSIYPQANDMKVGSSTSISNSLREIKKVEATDSSCGETMEASLVQSEKEAEKALEELQKRLFHNLQEDVDYLAGLEGALSYQKVPDEDIDSNLDYLEQEDYTTRSILEALFRRMHSRYKKGFSYQGITPDTMNLIQSRISGSPYPIFKIETRYTGFNCLILVDRSLSMCKEKATQVNRAVWLLRGALQAIPSILIEVVGFRGGIGSDETSIIFDYPSYNNIRTKPDSMFSPRGGTPLHVALRVACRRVSRKPGAINKVIVVTDGMPVYSIEGSVIKPEILMKDIRDTVIFYSSTGVAIECLCIDDSYGCTAIPEEALDYMFLGSRRWTRVVATNVAPRVVRMVKKSLESYFKVGV